MPLVFQALSGPDDPEKPSFSIPNGSIYLTLGRSGQNDFPINEKSVSTLHARIVREEADGDDTVELVDCDSRNGTFVNGDKIDRCLIGAGDLVRLADFEYRIIESDEAAALAEDLGSDPAVLEEELDSVRAELESVREEMEGQTQALWERSQDLEALEENSEKRSGELSGLRKENLALESQIAALQYELQQRDSAIESAHRSLEEAILERDSWRSNCDELSTQLVEKTAVQGEEHALLTEAQESLAALTERLAIAAERFRLDWKAWLPEWGGKSMEGGHSAEAYLEQIESGRLKFRAELDKVEPIWFAFGAGVQEELKRRCEELKREQRILETQEKEKRDTLEAAEKDLEGIREVVDEEIRRAQGLSRRGTKIALPEGFDNLVIANDREQAIYGALIKQIEYFNSLLTGYRKNRRLKEAVDELVDFRDRLEVILREQGVEKFDVPVGKVLTLKQRREVQILARKGWGTRGFEERTFQPGEVVEVIRTGYRVGGGGERGVILRKVEVLIREVSE